MADYNSSLPIRTENAGDAIVKVADATTPSQQLKVESDGSINVNAAFSPGTEVKITDGTETVNVSTSNELQVRDDDAIALLTTIDADTSNLDVALSTRATESTLSTLNAKFVSGTDIGDVTINNAAGASAVNIQDGGNSITVDGSVTVSATDLDIRDLVFATDKVDASGSTLGANSGVDIGDVTINNAAGASAVNIQDGGNSITVDGSVTVSATDLDIRDLTSASDSVEVLQDTHDDLNANANMQVANTDVSNANPVPMSDAGGSITVDATDLDIRDLTHASDSVKVGDGTEFLAINSDGSINVKLSDNSGTEQLNYNTAAAVAAAATSNHDYTTTGAFRLTGVEASASSKMKIELQIETAAASGVFNTQAVQFNSTAAPNMSLTFKSPPLVASGARVRIIRTNKDNQAQDLYSTIMGYNE